MESGASRGVVRRRELCVAGSGTSSGVVRRGESYIVGSGASSRDFPRAALVYELGRLWEPPPP